MVMAGEAGYVVHLHNLAAYIKLLYISKFIWKKKKKEWVEFLFGASWVRYMNLHNLTSPPFPSFPSASEGVAAGSCLKCHPRLARSPREDSCVAT